MRYFHQTRHVYVWAHTEDKLKKWWDCASWWRYNRTKHEIPIDFNAVLGNKMLMLHLTNALVYHYKTQYVSSAPCPEGTQKVFGQRHLVVKSCNKVYKNANNF